VSDATGFEVKGLSESIKLLGKVDKDLRREAGLVVRKAAKQLQAESRARLKATPGVRRGAYGYKKKKIPGGGVGRRATATKGTIFLNTAKYPPLGPAEFGWNSQFVPYRKGKGGQVSRKGVGRFMPQNAMKRRTFPIFRGNQSTFKFPKYGERRAALAGPGWIVQPVLRKRLGMIQKQVRLLSVPGYRGADGYI